MPVEFSDAAITRVTVNARDSKGRSASITFEEGGLLFHKSRPKQGKKALVPYDRLLELAVEGNAEFFKAPKRRKQTGR